MGQFALRARQDVGGKMARYSTVTRERALQQGREAGVGLGGSGPVRVMPFRKRAIRDGRRKCHWHTPKQRACPAQRSAA